MLPLTFPVVSVCLYNYIGATFHTVYILLPLVLMVLLVACTVVLYVAWRLWRRRRRRLPKSKENNITEENPEQGKKMYQTLLILLHSRGET